MGRVSSVLVLGLSLLLAAPVSAQDGWDVSGTYTLKGKIGWWFPPKITTRLTLTRTSDTTYDVVRVVTWDGSDATTGELRGTATFERVRKSKVRLNVVWPATEGAASRINDLLDGGVLEHGALTGRYEIEKNGKIKGWVTTPKRDGGTKDIKESGRADIDVTTAGDENAKPVNDAFKIKGLQSGVHLVGTAPRFELEPRDATLVILYGDNAKVDGQLLGFEGPGVVRVQAQKGDQGSAIVNLEAVSAEITQVTVEAAMPLEDAPAPHFARALGQEGSAATQPAVIKLGDALKLELTFKASKSLSAKTKVTLTGRGDGGLAFEGEVELQDLGSGQAVVVESKGPLSETVGINQVEIDWVVGTAQPTRTDLRVYTTFREPVDNPMPRYAPSSRQGKPLKTKLHYELACWWADGRSKNVGDSGDSICHKVDNMFRHLSHWKDLGSFKPPVPHYPEGAEPPKNYDDLGGSVSSRTGERSNTSLYYPPLEPTKDYQEYHHYRNNFGWWVLENPDYTGGRCNQQASLICDIFGTLGIKAEVYYIERVGRGKTSGRPMRRYYRSSRSSKSWNFHGQAKAYLDDGSEWLYDGSGSWPNTRINGRVEDLMKVPDGPYIAYWNPWRYEDGGRQSVPQSDWPDTWQGVPLQPGETQ